MVHVQKPKKKGSEANEIAVTLSLEFFTQLFLAGKLFSDLISAVFDDYEFGKMLGAGGFGQVIAATRKKDNLPVCSVISCYIW